MTTNGKGIAEEFNQAVDRFWTVYASFDAKNQCTGARGKLLDAADAVMFARDALKGADLHTKMWDDVTRDVADMSQCLSKHDIVLNGKPVQTSTGRMTYRLITKPRFDA